MSHENLMPDHWFVEDEELLKKLDDDDLDIGGDDKLDEETKKRLGISDKDIEEIDKGIEEIESDELTEAAKDKLRKWFINILLKIVYLFK